MRKPKKAKPDIIIDPSTLTPARRSFWVIKTYWVDLVLLNMAFVILCLPVITIPTALAALCKGLYRMRSGGEVAVFRDFWRDIKASFLRSLLPTFLMIAGFAVVAFCVYYSSVSGAQFGIVLPLAILLFCYGTVSFSMYAVPMAAILDLPLGTCLKNALILTFAYPLRNAAALLLIAGLTLLVAVTLPVSLPLLFFVHFSLCAHISMSFAEKGLSCCMLPNENKDLK